MITWQDFEKIDIRVGTILEVKGFPTARKPAYRLTIDFGNEGIKKSSAQITDLYSIDALVGKKIVAVINFPPKQIGRFISECLVLGVYDKHKQIVLLQPDGETGNGDKIG